MANEPVQVTDQPAKPAIPVITARDPDLSGLFPAGFDGLYEVHSYRNAASILANTCANEFREIVDTLAAFRIPTKDIVAAGGNKSKIAIRTEELLKPLGWLETRIAGDLLVRKVTRVASLSSARKGPKTVEKIDLHSIPNFVDGHKVDFVKGRVAFDMEWNSKDQTFDRDLYAMRAFYDCNVVTAGVLLTRSAELVHMFQEISARVPIKDFKSKFGASTTWMAKLTYRLDAGRAGGCPILALGIRPTVVDDFDKWKAANPVRRAATVLNIEQRADEDEADADG